MKYGLIKKKIFIEIFLFYFSIQLIAFCQINDNFEHGILDRDPNGIILDVNDYLNLSLLATSLGNLYIGAPFEYKTTINTTLNASTSIAVCNQNYILVACSQNYLLGKANIINGEYTPLIEYSQFSDIIVSKTSCCINIVENVVFIAINQPIPENRTTNAIIRLSINNKDDINDGPSVDSSKEIKKFVFNYDLPPCNTSRDISCEILYERTSGEYRLICINEKYETKNQIYVIIINSDMTDFQDNFNLYESSGEIGFRLYKLDKYYLRLVLRKKIYDLYFNSNFQIKKIAANANLTNYESFPHIFSYSNNYVISLRTHTFYSNYSNNTLIDPGFYFKINTLSSNYYLIYVNNYEGQIKLYNYYNDTSDYLICLYQSAEHIKYIIFKNNKEMFNIDSIFYKYKIKSNDEVNFNASNLFQSEYGSLYIETLKIITSTNDYTAQKYPTNTSSFTMDRETHIVSFDPSTNLWYDLLFCFEEISENFLRLFVLPNIKLTIQTCAFQCGSCVNNYYSCDNCRDGNYAVKDSDEDTNCYPINQLLEGYLYDSENKTFQKCYSTCQFCLDIGLSSTPSIHNCLSCSEGYLSSYEHLGNCYKYDDIDTDKYIIINSVKDESFSQIDSCTEEKNYIIASTKECVTECPQTINYNSYECIYVNFTEQEYGMTLDPQCTLTQLNPPKYYLGNYCYESCPTNSESIDLSNECKCLYAWHKNIITQEIECYSEDYCKYDGYKYYLSDTKECTSGCPSGYHQFNFQCYSEGCPIETNPSLEDEFKCISVYDYCYVDEYYKNICSNEQNISYIYNFNNTKQYLKECAESITYTISESITYLYRGICYLNCPENTKNNNEKKICDCLYFGYYSETEENNYICYNEEEKCVDKIPVNDLKICLDSINDCITKGYKIFNNECYSIDCPGNSEVKNSGDNFCYCRYYFYNNSLLECYDSTVASCQEKGYEYSNPLTLECFTSLEDCYNKNNSYYFNKYCYKDTCSDKISLSSITDDIVKNDFITNLNIEDEYLNRICVCNIFDSNIKWNFTVSNEGIYTQQCLTECQEEYEPNTISNRCVESCLSYKHYMFNGECYYEGCPTNTRQSDENEHVCICENYFLKNDNNELECYNSLEDCQNNNVLYYNEEAKQCFSSLDNCFSNNFNNFFNKVCYNDGCPAGKIALSDIEDEIMKNKFINFLGINDDLVDKICVCDIISHTSLKWTYNIIDKEQECVNTCDEDLYEIEPESITHKCIEKCNPLTDYIFNSICYRKNCPEGTELKNDGTRNCICKDYYYINEVNNMICCTSENINDENCIQNIVYPPEYYSNPDKCLAVYNNTCYSICPEGTCLTQKDINLVYCIKTQPYMTVFNNICFSNFESIELNVKNISDNNLYIIPSPKITIKAYSTEMKINEMTSNFSYIELGECETALRQYYNFQNDTILYILGIETPNKNKKSSVNVYNYGVYLGNGTQLNISLCSIEKITIYSTITNNSLIKLEEAKYFYSFGYDIYNESDEFYTDICSPASIDKNDITLSDRKKDFYPSNISMCNDSCNFEMVNLTLEKIKCICNIDENNQNDEEQDEEIDDEYSYTYVEYFLSLFNYKILLCQKLLLNPSNYLENIGFYLGGIISLICIGQMFINLNLGIRSLNQIIIDNEPSRTKLKEKMKKQFQKRKESFETKINIYKSKNKNLKKATKLDNNLNRESNPVKKTNKTNSKSNKKKEFIQNDKKNKKYLSAKILDAYSNNNKKDIKRKESIISKKATLKEKTKSIENKKKDSQIFKRNEYEENKNTTNIKLINNKNKKENIKNHIVNFIYVEAGKNKSKRLKKNAHLEEYSSNDENVEKKELNNVPYTQALRLDHRSYFSIFLYTIASKIEIINIFYYRNTYVHLSMSISIYIFSFLLDVTMNCFLYTDDVVSEKYHNEGSLETFTSLSLSFFSNILSSIITYYLNKLGETSDFLEIMIRDIILKKYYYINMIKFRKYLKLRLTLFYFIQILMCVVMTYYITIFCIIYSQSQISIMINYIYGVLESLAISFGIALIITTLRFLSLKYKCIKIYRTSQYLNNRF